MADAVILPKLGQTVEEATIVRWCKSTGDKIAKGELGVKAGKGFYTYPNPPYQSPDFLKQASP